jgi:hypothetical protein
VIAALPQLADIPAESRVGRFGPKPAPRVAKKDRQTLVPKLI